MGAEAGISEFEASLVCMARSRVSKATQRDCLLRHEVRALVRRAAALDTGAGSVLTRLQLVMVPITGCFWWRLWAGCWCHQLHEVLATAGLSGTSHHSLFATQQAHLQIGTEQEVGWAAQAWIPTALARVSTHCSGAVGALPTACALLVLHRTELVMIRASPGAPCAMEESRGAQCWPVGGWGEEKGSKPQATHPRLVGEPPCLGFWETSLKGQSR